MEYPKSSTGLAVPLLLKLLLQLELLLLLLPHLLQLLHQLLRRFWPLLIGRLSRLLLVYVRALLSWRRLVRLNRRRFAIRRAIAGIDILPGRRRWRS